MCALLYKIVWRSPRRFVEWASPKLASVSTALLPGLLVLVTACGDPEAPPPIDSVATGAVETLDAQRILDLAIDFHDPSGSWSTGTFPLTIESTRPDQDPRFTRLLLANGEQRFELEMERDGHHVENVVWRDEQGVERVANRVDGSAQISAELIDTLRLSDEAVLRRRNYHLYLYGLPMKLRDPGTRIEELATREEFEGRDGWAVRVTYDPEVGSDTWIFYFDPEDWQLFGYRFYHDETAGDGEYIVLEGLADVGGLRLPRERTWYTHQGDRLLGTDTIVEASQFPGAGRQFDGSE